MWDDPTRTSCLGLNEDVVDQEQAVFGSRTGCSWPGAGCKGTGAGCSWPSQEQAVSGSGAGCKWVRSRM